MNAKGIYALVAAATAFTVGGLNASEAQAQHPGAVGSYGCIRPYSRADLFYNYYAPPCGDGVGAQLYVSPRPVPQHVGHTYITYQPLMPHEFLYKHHRTYFRYHPGSGVTKTKVHWW
jgi:hypothetical protein